MSEPNPELMERLQKLVGVKGASPIVARDAVNQPMIRHWCDAVDDRNPVYTDPEYATHSIHGGIVSPPTMLQAWTMPGLRPPNPEADAKRARSMTVMQLLDEAGFASVVAANCTQEYKGALRPGEMLSVSV